MIPLPRGLEPLVLQQNKSTWTTVLLSSAPGAAREKALRRYRHPQIKKALAMQFHGKCAYCESHILHVDYGHIEHFRPKAIPAYLALAFEWTNLFLACSVCNGAEYKGVRFPESDEGGPPINPCEDRPEEHLLFIFDSKSKLATVVHRTERGRISVELFGLNRPELRSRRSAFVEKLIVLSRFASTDEEAQRLFQEAQGDGQEYAAFARSLASQS
jgi:uncharacterized protein (TIGR02646 family)